MGWVSKRDGAGGYAFPKKRVILFPPAHPGTISLTVS